MTKSQPGNSLTTLLNETIRGFANAFCEASRELFLDRDGRLTHPGEFGAFREAITRDYLKAFVPQRMGIDTGFVVTASGQVSSQCDVIIYDRSVTPLLQTLGRQRFFPVESVCAIGEVKSVLTLADLKTALRKLAKVKLLRESAEPAYVHCSKPEGVAAEFKPERDELDQVVTFLICERFDFDLEEHAEDLLGSYVSEHPKFPVNLRHNFVLSIKNGLLSYVHPRENALYPFPSKSTVIVDFEDTSEPKSARISAVGLRNRMLLPNPESFEHVRAFSVMLHLSLALVSVLFPDMGRYIAPQDDIRSFDVEVIRGF